MNIHYNGHKPGKPNNTAKPPRPRTGLDTSRPHNVYAGGKHLRRVLARLKQRTEGVQQGKRPDRINSNEATAPWGSYGFTAPGSYAG